MLNLSSRNQFPFAQAVFPRVTEIKVWGGGFGGNSAADEVQRSKAAKWPERPHARLGHILPWISNKITSFLEKNCTVLVL